MFGIGMPEIILILVVALVVLGPKKLPEMAKSLGKAFREFRKASHDLKQAIGLDDDILQPDIKPKSAANANNSSSPDENGIEAEKIMDLPENNVQEHKNAG